MILCQQVILKAILKSKDGPRISSLSANVWKNHAYWQMKLIRNKKVFWGANTIWKLIKIKFFLFMFLISIFPYLILGYSCNVRIHLFHPSVWDSYEVKTQSKILLRYSECITFHPSIDFLSSKLRSYRKDLPLLGHLLQLFSSDM